MDTEGIAVWAVEDVLFSLPSVKSYFDKNDRTPLTDGTIAVHSSNKHSNANLLGIVTVQIKGQGVKNSYKAKKLESYQLDRAVLEGYLHSGGVLFFLVLINLKKPAVRTVYYTVLTPFKIQSILKGMAEGQKTVAIHTEKMPGNPKRIEPILGLAIQAQNERPSHGFDVELFRVAETIKLYSDTDISLDSPVRLEYKRRNFSVELQTTTGMTVPLPGEMIIYPADYAEQPTTASFQSGDFIFNNPTKKRIDEDSVEFILSEGLRLEIPKPGAGKPGTINLSLQDSLAARYNDIGFFLACVDTGSYKLNGSEVRFEGTIKEPGEDLRAHFGYLSRLTELLVALDVDPALIKMSEIDENRSIQLGRLYDAMIQQQEFAADYESPGRILQPIGPWFLEQMCVQAETVGMWKCHGLFSKQLSRQFFWVSDEGETDQKVVRLSPYDLIDEERLPYTLNLKLNELVPSYEEISEYPDTFARANNMVIRLIKAADTVPARFEEFMSAAEALNSWLIESDGALAPHLINRWQILERRKLLTTSELAEIRNLRREAMRNANNQVTFCCSVLLKDFDEADDAYHALTEHDQTTVRQWPIWTLHHHKDVLDEVTETS